jgi:hypothetical protein
VPIKGNKGTILSCGVGPLLVVAGVDDLVSVDAVVVVTLGATDVAVVESLIYADKRRRQCVIGARKRNTKRMAHSFSGDIRH